MKDIVVWAIHAPAGTLVLVAALVTMFATKGGATHRKVGSCFTVSMMLMLVSGTAVAYINDSIDDMILGAFVMYTVFTAWLTVHRKKNETGLLEVIALIWVVSIAIIAFSISNGWNETAMPVAHFIWAGLAIFCALGDFRNLYQSGLSGTQRIVRHVWRVGFSLLWAALAFTDKIVKMLGANLKSMREEQLLLIVAIPVMAILITIVYWIAKILFFSDGRFAYYGKSVA